MSREREILELHERYLETRRRAEQVRLVAAPSDRVDRGMLHEDQLLDVPAAHGLDLALLALEGVGVVHAAQVEYLDRAR